MNEIKIDLGEINSQEFFGNQNSNIAKLRRYFPKIKIIARGNTLKAYGEDTLLEEFAKRTDMLVAHFGKYNILNEEIIERIVLARNDKDPLMGGTETLILHGVGGKLIKAKTLNQKGLVELKCQKITKKDEVVALTYSDNIKSEILEIHKKNEVTSFVKMKSSLKFCVIAAGEFDLYVAEPRACEWDIAAGHAILKNAGGIITDFEGNEILYGKKDFINPSIVLKRSHNLK